MQLRHDPTHGLEPNVQSLGGTDVTPAATEVSPCRGFQDDAALSFQPWLFLFCLHFITLCYPFLKCPPQLSWVLSLVGVPTLVIPNLPAARGGLSITWPASECHHFCCGMGRVEPLAWLAPRTESEWLMLENWPYPPPLSLDISTPPHL